MPEPSFPITWNNMNFKSIVINVLAGFLGLMLVSCATVKSYEREKLADPIMEREDEFSKQSLATPLIVPSWRRIISSTSFASAWIITDSCCG